MDDGLGTKGTTRLDWRKLRLAEVAFLVTLTSIGAPGLKPAFFNVSVLIGQSLSLRSFPQVTSWNCRSSKFELAPPRVRQTNSRTTSSCPEKLAIGVEG